MLPFVQTVSHRALSQHAARKIMPTKTMETVGHCAVAGPKFEYWPSKVRTAGVTDRPVSQQSAKQLHTVLSQCLMCRFVALGTDRQTWLGQSGVSEPRGQQFETAETVRARAVRAL